MSNWACPSCGVEYDYARNPDVLEGLTTNNKATFLCDCGTEFEMWVDFDPHFTVDKASARRPSEVKTADL